MATALPNPLPEITVTIQCIPSRMIKLPARLSLEGARVDATRLGDHWRSEAIHWQLRGGAEWESSKCPSVSAILADGFAVCDGVFMAPILRITGLIDEPGDGPEWPYPERHAFGPGNPQADVAVVFECLPALRWYKRPMYLPSVFELLGPRAKEIAETYDLSLPEVELWEASKHERIARALYVDWLEDRPCIEYAAALRELL